MKIVQVFILLMSVGFIAGGKLVVYSEEQDSVSLQGAGDKGFVIRAPKGSKIIFYMDSITLSANSKLTIYDGNSGKDYVFTKVRSEIRMSPVNKKYLETTITLPWMYMTTRRRLTVVLESKSSDDRFQAHYITYSDSGCKKASLQNVVEDPTKILDTECDTVEDVPNANQCGVTVDCGDHYQQNDKSLTCRYGDWNGDIKCYPMSDEIENCDFDEDSVCPYSAEEVARYYVDEGGLDGEDALSLGRSSGRRRYRFNCGSICDVHGNGRRARSCGARGRTFFYINCLVCRIVHRCKRPVVVF